MKKNFKIIFIVLLALVLCFSLWGCNDSNANADESDYTIEIVGLSTETIVVTKSQILAIDAEKHVEYTDDKPCYASDKTDDDGNRIPHSLKGVYLDDILDVYANGEVSGSYSALTLKAEDGYETVLTSDIYNFEQGGSKMIVAYEYDGVRLSQAQSSGSLRVIFPDQVANSWVKKLKTITFSDAALTPPAPTVLNFMELLDESYFGSFDKTIATGASSADYTFYGISISRLLDEGILSGDGDDKMYLIAWDYITNGSDYFYREYTNWKSNEYYANSFLVYEQQLVGGQKEDKAQAPTFDGENIQKGMSVKNTLALSVKDTALMSLEIAFERFDKEKENEILLKDVLELVSMYKADENYTIVDIDDSMVSVGAADLEDATIAIVDGVYTLQYGINTLAIKSINIASD